MQDHTEDEGFRLMVDNSTDVLCRITLDRRCVYCSPSSVRVLGWKPEEMLQLFPKDLIHPDHARSARLSHERHLTEAGRNDVPETFRIRKKDGNYALLEVHSSLMRNKVTHAPWQILLNMRDVSKQRLLEQELESLALTDPLTGLGNRRAFDRALDHEWRRAHREQGEISLLMVDVDNFKAINDLYGHDAGDDCLRAIAETMTEVARRSGDLAARYGGEEFALILPSTDLEGATGVAEQLRLAIQALELPHDQNHEHGSVVTVSVGAATAVVGRGARFAGPSSLIKAADAALYKAKQEGRNRVERALLALS